MVLASKWTSTVGTVAVGVSRIVEPSPKQWDSGPIDSQCSTSKFEGAEAQLEGKLECQEEEGTEDLARASRPMKGR